MCLHVEKVVTSNVLTTIITVQSMFLFGKTWRIKCCENLSLQKDMVILTRNSSNLHFNSTGIVNIILLLNKLTTLKLNVSHVNIEQDCWSWCKLVQCVQDSLNFWNRIFTEVEDTNNNNWKVPIYSYNSLRILSPIHHCHRHLHRLQGSLLMVDLLCTGHLLTQTRQRAAREKKMQT